MNANSAESRYNALTGGQAILTPLGYVKTSQDGTDPAKRYGKGAVVRCAHAAPAKPLQNPLLLILSLIAHRTWL